MHVVAITCVKNEIDIIEAFVRHTLVFADRLVALDHGSSDGTLTVLRALQAEGLPLDVVEDPSPGLYQSQRMTRLMREWAVERAGADWVLPLDADEFVGVAPGGSLLPADARGDQPVALPWRSYVPGSEDDAAQPNPVLRIRRRLKKESSTWVKVLVPRQLASRPDAVLDQGNHHLLLDGKPCPQAVSAGAYLAHFPLRSPGQYLSKIALQVLQYLAMPERRVDAGWHYRDAYALLRRDPKAFLASYAEAALGFAAIPGAPIERETIVDPLPYRGGPLRHTPPIDEEVSGWLNILSWAEDMARRHAAVTACLDEHNRVALDRFAGVLGKIHAHFAEQYHQALSWHSQLMLANQQNAALQRHHEAVQPTLQQQVQSVQQPCLHQLESIQQTHHQQLESVQQMHHRQLESVRQALHQQLVQHAQIRDAMLASYTWRVGSLIVGPLRPMKGFMKAVVRVWRRGRSWIAPAQKTAA